MFQSISIWDEDGPRPVLVLISSSSRPCRVLTPSSSCPRPQSLKFISSSSRPEDELRRGPSQDDSSRPTDPWIETPIKRSHAVVLFEEDDPLNTVCSGKKRGHMLLSKSNKFSVCDGTGWHSLTSGKPMTIANSRTGTSKDFGLRITGLR